MDGAGTPRTWFAGKSSPEDKRGPDPSTIGALILLVISPIGLVFAIVGYLFFSMGRFSWKMIGAVTGAYFTLFLLTGQARTGMLTRYLPVVHDLKAALTAGNVSATISSRWPDWLIAQAPLSILLGLSIATGWSAWKWVRRPSWQNYDRRPSPVELFRRKRNMVKISADQDGPNNGVTLGVDAEGRRVVQTDSEAAAHTFVTGSSGSGKALDVTTPIPTPSGWVEMGDLTVGDYVFDETGAPTLVTGAFDVMHDHDCFDVVFSDGSVITADAEHLWKVGTVASRASTSRAATHERARKPAGSKADLLALTAAQARVEPGDLLTVTELTAALGWEPRRGRALSLYTWAHQLEPVEVSKTGPNSFVRQDGTTVTRSSGAPVRRYDAVDLLALTHERLSWPFSDQRETAVQEQVLTTRQIAAGVVNADGKRQYSVKLAGVAQYPVRDLVMAPYLLGMWLGDGTTGAAQFSTADEELLQPWRDAGFHVRFKTGYDYKITGGLYRALRLTNVLDTKRIPAVYMIASEDQRRALLAGLMDTDGTHVKSSAGVSFTNKNSGLAHDVHELAASLGYRPTIHSRMATCNGKVCGPYWVVSFQAPDGDVFRLARKRDAHQQACPSSSQARTSRRYVVAVSPVASRPVRCIEVAAPSHLFLAGRSYIPTHNTLGILMKARDMIRRGDGVVYVDLKGGPDVPVQLAEWAARYGRPFLHWSIHDTREDYDGPAEAPAFYDPVGRGDASRRKDLIAGAIGHSANGEIYQRLAAEYLQVAFKVILAVPAPKRDSLMDVMDMLNPVQLRARAVSSGDPELQHLVDDTLGVFEENGQVRFQMDEVQRSAIKGTAAFLRLLVHSTAGAWLRKDPDGRFDINLRDAADNGAIIVFSLDSSNYEDVSKLAANLIIQDLKTLSSELRKNQGAHKVNVIIDEFSATGSDNVLGLLARARDANMPVVLATQALADLRRENMAFLEQVLGIVNCFVIHRANTEHDAEVFAGLTGKEKRYKVRMGVEQTSGMPGSVGTGAATGQGHVEEVDEYRVMPHEIQQLKQGQMVYIANSPDNRIVTLKVILESVQAVAEARAKLAGGPTGFGHDLVAQRPRIEVADTPEMVTSSAGFDAWAEEPSGSETTPAATGPVWDGAAATLPAGSPWGGSKRGGIKTLTPVGTTTSRTTRPSFDETVESFEKPSPATVVEPTVSGELLDGTEVRPIPVVKVSAGPLLDLNALRSRTLVVAPLKVTPPPPPRAVAVTAPPVSVPSVAPGSPLGEDPDTLESWDPVPAQLSAPWLTSGTDELGRTYRSRGRDRADVADQDEQNDQMTPTKSGDDPEVPSTKKTAIEPQLRSVFSSVNNNLTDDWS